MEACVISKFERSLGKGFVRDAFFLVAFVLASPPKEGQC